MSELLGGFLFRRKGRGEKEGNDLPAKEKKKGSAKRHHKTPKKPTLLQGGEKKNLSRKKGTARTGTISKEKRHSQFLGRK